MDKSSTTLDQLIQEFEVLNKVEGKSPRTVEKYNFVLGQFLSYLRDRGKPVTLGDLTLHNLQRAYGQRTFDLVRHILF